MREVFCGIQLDDKPTGVPDGSEFIEVDTKDIYVFYNGTWYKQKDKVLSKLETKKITITENETKTYSPSEGKIGFSSVEITTNVSGADLSDYFNSTIMSGDTYSSGVDKMLKLIPSNTTVSGTSLNYAFYCCSSITTIPQLNTSSVTKMNNMFYRCSSITTIPQLNTSSVTDMGSMFSNCSSITTIPLLDTSSVTDMNNMFNRCSSITTIPQLNTSKVTNMSNMFSNCSLLETIPQLNTSKVTNMMNLFNGCPNLNNNSLYNILAMSIDATSYTGTKTLKQLGLSSTQATTCQGLSNYQDFLDAGWTIGY